MHLELPEKRYYGIGELAKAMNVNTSLIRFWEKEFDVLRPKKNAKGNRKFSQDDVKNLKLIYRFYFFLEILLKFQQKRMAFYS